MSRSDGMVVLVTGGASGLGKATVERFLRQGSKVVICDLPQSIGAELAASLGAENALFCPVDVQSEEDVSKALNACKAKFGRLDVVVNCAGIVSCHGTYNFIEGVPHGLEDFRRVLNINTVGTFNVIRLAVGLIAANEPNQAGHRGVVINVASMAAYDANPGVAAYSASKGAVVAMTGCIAKDLMHQGIRVCAIAPGAFDTPMVQKALSTAAVQNLVPLPVPPKLSNPEDFAILVESIVLNGALNGETIKIGSLI